MNEKYKPTEPWGTDREKRQASGRPEYELSYDATRRFGAIPPEKLTEDDVLKFAQAMLRAKMEAVSAKEAALLAIDEEKSLAWDGLSELYAWAAVARSISGAPTLDRREVELAVDSLRFRQGVAQKLFEDPNLWEPGKVDKFWEFVFRVPGSRERLRQEANRFSKAADLTLKVGLEHLNELGKAQEDRLASE